MAEPVSLSENSVLAARLRAALPELTRSEAVIAQWLMMNEATLGLETGASIAAKTGVSEITVSRFLRRLGYKGMAALKADLQAHGLKAHLHTADRYLRLLDGELGALLKRDAEAVLSLGSQIARPEWNHAVEAINSADEVFVTGFQTVRGLAEDFARRLAIIRRAVHFIPAHDTGLAEWIPSEGEQKRPCCLILIDTVPYAREAEAVVRLARRQNMSVVVITDELNTWASPHTAYVFFTATKAGAYLESTGPMASMLNLLIHAVAQRDQNGATGRLSAWAHILRELDIH